MSELREHKRWSWDEYVDWEARQPGKYELVDEQVRAMGGGTTEHDLIANNLRRELWPQLRGRSCRVQGPDLKVRAGTSGRYPDAVIDCGERVRGSTVAQEPMAVFEVLSKSTGWIDQNTKLRDYDAAATIQYYVLISQDEPRALIYARGDKGHLDFRGAAQLEGMDASLDLPELQISIPFSALYADVEFEPS